MRDAEKDLAMCEAAPKLMEPYVTSKGGVVVLNGPFAIDKANACCTFIYEAREALPYWIKRALAAEEKLKWVSRDAAEMHDDWIDSSARATAATSEIDRLQEREKKLVEALRLVHDRADIAVKEEDEWGWATSLKRIRERTRDTLKELGMI